MNERTYGAMKKALVGTAACGRPILLDPVGVMSSSFRFDAARTLLQTGAITVIKGNSAEGKALLLGRAKGERAWIPFLMTIRNGLPKLCLQVSLHGCCNGCH